MSNRNKKVRLFVILLAAVLLLSSCAASALETARSKKKKSSPNVAVTAVTMTAPVLTAGPEAASEATSVPGPMETAQELADYIFEHGGLPENFVTKNQAQDMGWKTKYRNVGDISPGLAIGGDYFGNYEKKLPVVKGRKYYEADCFYQGGPRNEYRIIFSNDGHVWYTEDHYNTFIELFPTGP